MGTDSEKVIWIIGFPKSGNTWLSYLVSYIANLPYFDFADLNLTPKREKIRRLVSGNLDHLPLEGFRAIYKSHKPPHKLPIGQGDMVIYIQRDPRDMYVSYKHFMNNKFSGWKGRLRWRLHRLFGVKHLITWLYKDQQYHISMWGERSDAVIKYENLQLDPERELREIFKNFDTVKDDIIRAAIQEFSFNKMAGGRKKGDQDNRSFYRKGISGGWQNELNTQEFKIFEELL